MFSITDSIPCCVPPQLSALSVILYLTSASSPVNVNCLVNGPTVQYGLQFSTRGLAVRK